MQNDQKHGESSRRLGLYGVVVEETLEVKKVLMLNLGRRGHNGTKRMNQWLVNIPQGVLSQEGW